MATQLGQYQLLNKARVDIATGAVTIVAQLIEMSSGRVVLDDVPINLVATIRNNLQAVAGQYDVIGT